MLTRFVLFLSVISKVFLLRGKGKIPLPLQSWFQTVEITVILVTEGKLDRLGWILLNRRRNVYPGSLRQSQMCSLSETTELSMGEIHHHVLQFVDGTKTLWRPGWCWINRGVGDQELRRTISIV